MWCFKCFPFIFGGVKKCWDDVMDKDRNKKIKRVCCCEFGFVRCCLLCEWRRCVYVVVCVSSLILYVK